MKFYRNRKPEIISIRSLARTYILDDGQVFYETPAAYEIWQETPFLRRMVRFSKSKIYWVSIR